jgi:hypothetical protein
MFFFSLCLLHALPISPTFHPPSFDHQIFGEERHFHSHFVSQPQSDNLLIGVFTVFCFAAHGNVRIKVKLSDRN